jgi:hypothetical protein
VLDQLGRAHLTMSDGGGSVEGSQIVQFGHDPQASRTYEADAARFSEAGS